MRSATFGSVARFDHTPSAGEPDDPDRRPPQGEPPALSSPRDLAKIYGPSFARGVAGLPVGRWAGPIPSTFGWHLVWVHESVPGEPATLAEVRNQVALGLANERREARLAAFLAGREVPR